MIIPGFVYGLVKENKDPEGAGRIKAYVPVIFDGGTPYWCRPAGWPGAGGKGPRGSKYHVRKGAQVCLLFEAGNTDSGAVFIPGPYPFGTGPDSVGLAETEDERLNRTCIWEDSTFAIYLTEDATDKRLVLLRKGTVGVEAIPGTGAAIVIDATDGPNKKSTTISIEAQTAVNIRSKHGLVNIEGVVQINGRRVRRGGGDI